MSSRMIGVCVCAGWGVQAQVLALGERANVPGSFLDTKQAARGLSCLPSFPMTPLLSRQSRCQAGRCWDSWASC